MPKLGKLFSQWLDQEVKSGNLNTYYDLIQLAGFEIERIQINNYEFISKNARNAGMKYGIQSISLLARKS